jgi:hypothetical protein
MQDDATSEKLQFNYSVKKLSAMYLSSSHAKKKEQRDA